MARIGSHTRFTFYLTLDDGSELGPIKNGMREVVAWERKNKRGFGAESLTNEQLLWTAWAAGKNQGIISEAEFDRFLPRVVDFEIDNPDDSTPDPTLTDQSEG